MSDDIAKLEQKLRELDDSLVKLAGAKYPEQLIGIIHRPGWTTPKESELVQAMVDTLQDQLTVFQRGQETLITIADGMGTGWSYVQAMPNLHFSLGAATTAVWPPPPAFPGGFVDGTIIVVTDRLYAIGGSGQSNDVQAFQPATNTWTAAAVLPTPRFGLAVAVGADHRIYAIGGRSNPLGVLQNVVEAFAPAAFHFKLGPGFWTGGLSPMPTARERPAATTGKDGRIYVVGGSNGSDTNTSAPLTTLEIYDAASDAWSSGKGLTTARDSVAATTGNDGRIYAIGGFDGSRTLSSVEAYDVSNNTWASVAAMSMARTDLAAVTAPDGRIYAIGGQDGSTVYSSVEIYDPSTESWTPGPSMSSKRYSFAAAIGPDGRLYAIGGQDGLFELNSVEALTF